MRSCLSTVEWILKWCWFVFDLGRDVALLVSDVLIGLAWLGGSVGHGERILYDYVR